MANPGKYTVILGGPGQGLDGRFAALHVRDSFAIVLPGPRILTGWLFRVPLEKIVAENLLRHATGVIDIESCRVGTTKRVPGGISRTAGNSLSGSVDGSLRRETGKEGGHDPNVGRWPPNALFVHTSDCRFEGERRIQGSVGGHQHRKGPSTSDGIYGKYAKRSMVAVPTDENGKESYLSWVCGPSCSIRTLDEGEARFFPQFASLVECLAWLGTLVKGA